MHKFYGQFEPPVDKFIFERYFPDTNTRGCFVECGAFDGTTESSCKFFEETMDWVGFNLEAAPHNYKKLVENRPKSTNLQVGLSNHEGQATFTHVISPTLGADFGNGSILHTQKHIASLIEGGCTFDEVQITVTTWSAFVEKENIRSVDLFVLDVEGHELAVIEGMKGARVLPDILCVEVGHLDFDALRQEIQALGYTYDTTSHVNAFFIKNEKLPLFLFRTIAHLRASARGMPETDRVITDALTTDQIGPHISERSNEQNIPPVTSQKNLLSRSAKWIKSHWT